MNISNSNSNTLVNGTSGNDSVYNEYDLYCTINTGEGNDLISLSSKAYGDTRNSKENVIIYKSGDGNDTIYGFNADSTLNIVKSEFTSSTPTTAILLLMSVPIKSQSTAARLYQIRISLPERIVLSRLRIPK